MNKKYIIAAVAILIVAITSVILYNLSEDPIEKKFRELSERNITPRQLDPSILDNLKYEDLGEGAYARVGELSFDEVVALMVKNYGKNISNAQVQVRMLNELIKYLKEKYPDKWVEMLQELLYAAFPDLAQSLFALSENIYKYQKYLDENQEKLATMTPEERREVLHSARGDIFGDKADEIWSAEIKSQKVRDSLAEIKKSDASLTEKLGTYKQSITDAYGEQTPYVLENHKQNLVNGFLDAVQPELQKMNAIERKEALKEIRTTMGMDGAAITRWEALDDERDQRYNNGLTYMEKRKEIVSSYAGSDKEQKLDELRKKYFGEEASTIKNEEESGFFRYENQRRIGRE